jgi:hypothetical protein
MGLFAYTALNYDLSHPMFAASLQFLNVSLSIRVYPATRIGNENEQSEVSLLILTAYSTRVPKSSQAVRHNASVPWWLRLILTSRTYRHISTFWIANVFVRLYPFKSRLFSRRSTFTQFLASSESSTAQDLKLIESQSIVIFWTNWRVCWRYVDSDL